MINLNNDRRVGAVFYGSVADFEELLFHEETLEFALTRIKGAPEGEHPVFEADGDNDLEVVLEGTISQFEHFFNSESMRSDVFGKIEDFGGFADVLVFEADDDGFILTSVVGFDVAD
ncbi:MAG: hypothetical protein V5A79_07515 [Candidatus Bipolaricaulota bacterium]